MLDWNQSTAPPLDTTRQNTQETTQDALYPPYPPPDRPCFVCGQQTWRWTGTGYVCGGLGNAAHTERDASPWIHIQPQPS